MPSSCSGRRDRESDREGGVAPYPPYFNVADVAVRGGLIACAVLALARRRRPVSKTTAQSLSPMDRSR